MKSRVPILYDRWLVLATFGLLGLGLLMVASSSLVISERQFGQPFHYLTHQAVYIGLGLICALVIMRTEVATWSNVSEMLLFISIALLIVVLLPGVGRTVNGSTRWIGLGPIALQVSELAKLCIIAYLAGYLVRHGEQVRTQVSGFVKPMLILAVVAVLLLKEPDFGATVVILATALGMMFLAGVRLWQFALLAGFVGLAIIGLAISSPYRLARLTSFLNPWANQFDSGYQLTQSLIAFGRGGWFGVGLGESVQKLFYLPEAHTDFLFAVLAEELGLIGVLVVIILFTMLVLRAFTIAKQAFQLKNYFAAYLAFGMGLWVGLQAMINIGVNAGVLPTKGLTLPLMSSGGSSMLISCMVIGLLLRIDYENRCRLYGITTR